MRYKVTATVDGKRKYFYGTSKEQAKQKRAEFLEQNTREIHSFGYCAEKWWEEKQTEIAFNTTKGYKPALERAIAEFGEEDITAIKPSDIAHFIKEFAKGDRADKTVRTQLLVINAVFKYAINEMETDIQNPARDVEIPRRLRKTKVSCPTDEEIKIIKAADDSLFKSMAMFFMYSGLRRGELLCLTADDIDIENSTIKVNKSLYHDNNKPMVKKTKTENGERLVPILKALVPYIPKHKGVLFDENGHYMRESFFSKGWNKWCKGLGIHVTPHQLRHLYASMLYDNKVDAFLSSHLLGHSNYQTTADVYMDLRLMKQKFDMLLDMDVTTD